MRRIGVGMAVNRRFITDRSNVVMAGYASDGNPRHVQPKRSINSMQCQHSVSGDGMSRD